MMTMMMTMTSLNLGSLGGAGHGQMFAFSFRVVLTVWLGAMWLVLMLLLLLFSICVAHPGALAQLDGSVANVLAVHISQRGDVFLWIGEAHEAIAFGLLRALISDDPHPLHRLVASAHKSGSQELLVDLVTQIATEQSKIPLWPIC